MKKREIDHKELRDGPLRDRSCTDILCCLFFFAFLGAMCSLGYYGYLHGDPYAVIYPYDSAGNQCGRPDTPTSSYPYIYFITPFAKGSTKWKACIKDCPKSSLSTVECYTTKWVTGCEFTVNGTHYDPIASTPMFSRLCMPTAYNEGFSTFIGNEDMMSAGSDIIRTRYIILAVLGVSLVVSILYLLMLRYLVGLLVWIVLLAMIVMISGFGGYYTYKLYDEKDPITSDTLKYQYWGISIACYIVAFFLVLLTYCLRKSIELAVAIMKSATVFMDDLFSIILVPIVLFLVSTVVYILWIAAIIYLYSSGTLVIDDTANVIAKFSHDTSLKNALYFEILGILWINSFKIALLQYIVSFACCVWYFSENKETLDSPICRGVKTGLFYHIGSLAFGSFLLSLVILFKWVLVLLSKINPAARENEIIGFCCKCVICFVQCLERFVKFLDHQAYIRIALTGEGFCSAAQSAFEIMLGNAGRFSALGGIGYIFNFLGKAAITVASTWTGFYYITNVGEIKDSIFSPLGPVIAFAIASYLVAALFMGVYETAADTIIQAFILDEEIHGKGCSVFAPEPIKEFIKEYENE